MPSLLNKINYSCLPHPNDPYVEALPLVKGLMSLPQIGQTFSFIGILDTGADITLFTNRGLDLLKIIGISTKFTRWPTFHPFGPYFYRFPYKVKILFPHIPSSPISIKYGIYFSMKIDHSYADVILGRDVMKETHLIYCGEFKNIQWVL